MEQQSLSKYDRVKVTANAHLVFLNDVLTQSVMDMIQVAKKLGIFKQKRKQILNQMMAEISSYEKFIARESGTNIDKRADQCEAFSEQIESVKSELLSVAETLLIEEKLPNPSYLSYIHLTRVTYMAVDLAIKGWAKRLVSVAFPRKPDYNMYIFKQEQFYNRLHQLVSYEFSKYQEGRTESEDTVRATKAYLSKVSDTDMICRIIGGQIIPSWKKEDLEKAEEEEANKTETEAV